MTPKQAAYVMAYVENGGNGTRACAAAGYLGSDNALNQQSRDNLQVPTIRAELERLGALPAQRVAASLAAAAGSAAWIVERAVALADGARQDRDKIQALALLARRHAEFRDAGPAVEGGGCRLPAPAPHTVRCPAAQFSPTTPFLHNAPLLDRFRPKKYFSVSPHGG